ncbi:MAG: polysaccharide biosynthesis protein [Hespellia sp.]|nr:polysaccharide biosynthesis protein [Hespellia sp.]
MKHNALVKGAFLLTAISFLTRIMGFFYRIYLSRTFGEENVGLYQLIFPIFSLCLAFSVSGIQTALSRIIAYKLQKNDREGAMNSLKTALFFSVLLSFFTLLIVQQNAVLISEHFIGDIRCVDLLIIMTYALPFATVHSCISGYYFGLKQAAIPAVSQLLEQIFRILCVVFLCVAAQKKNIPLRITFAVAGIVIGEAASSLCTVLSLKKVSHTHHLTGFFTNLKELASLSVPLTSNRIVLTVFQSIEAVSIPSQLQRCHYTAAQSLSIYGVLTGMALPCILFPSAITNSFSLLLTPTVAGIQSASDTKHLSAVIKRSSFLCFTLGMMACVFFLLFGTAVGSHLFHSTLAGYFIITLAWICPFFYLNTTLSSILNGLGKTSTTFLVNILGISIRILSIFCLIPVFDLKGYLWGLLLSQMIISLLYYLCLRKYLVKSNITNESLL